MAASDSDSKSVDLQDLNPEFRRRLGNFLTAAKKEGIPTHIIEAYRSNEIQAQYYREKQQGLRPYPVAPPGKSFHNYGYASDVLADDRSRQGELIKFAYAHPEFGISPLPNDDPHFQISGYQHTADILRNPPQLQEGPAADLSQFVSPAFGYSVAPGTSLAASPGPPHTPTPGPMMFSGLNPEARGMRNNNPGNLESNDWTKGLPGYKGTDGRFAIFDTPEHGAAALDRNLSNYGGKGINTPLGIASTWAPASDNNNPDSYGARIATALGVGPTDKIDMSDPNIRNKIASAIGVVENGPGNSSGFRTAYGGSVPTGGETAIAAAPAAPTFGESMAKGDVGGALRALATKPPTKTDDKGNPVEQKSTLENVADAFGSKGGQQERGPPQIPEMPPAPVVTDPTPGLAPAAQQLWATVAQASAKPLSWTSEPYGSNAGLQRIRQGGGTTLNNTGYGYG